MASILLTEPCSGKFIAFVIPLWCSIAFTISCSYWHISASYSPSRSDWNSLAILGGAPDGPLLSYCWDHCQISCHETSCSGELLVAPGQRRDTSEEGAGQLQVSLGDVGNSLVGLVSMASPLIQAFSPQHWSRLAGALLWPSEWLAGDVGPRGDKQLPWSPAEATVLLEQGKSWWAEGLLCWNGISGVLICTWKQGKGILCFSTLLCSKAIQVD